MAHEAGAEITDAIAIYNPNGSLAISAFIAFLIPAIGYWYRHFKSPSPRLGYMRPIRYGATIMAFGYLCRFTRRDQLSAWSWLFETLFILLSPCLFLAQVYILLPRLAASLNAEDCLLINSRAIKWIFITADVTTVLAQLAGTALTITFGDLVKVGKIVVTVGLWVQLVAFLSFMGVFITFTNRVGRRSRLVQSNQSELLGKGTVGLTGGVINWKARWTSVIYINYAACTFMLIRSIYRVAEYTSGANSALAYSEAAFYILDSLMMLLIVIAYHIVWPPNHLEDVNSSLPPASSVAPDQLQLAEVGRSAALAAPSATRIQTK